MVMTSDKMNYYKMDLEMWQTKVESEAVKNKAFQAHTHTRKNEHLLLLKGSPTYPILSTDTRSDPIRELTQ